MKILLVDDHPLFLDGLKSLLTTRCIDVVGTARDGMEAVAQARALKPDAILMDIQMPRLNGLGATRLVKAEQPRVKIVMLTMSEDDQDLFEAIKSGACGYLLKTDDSEQFFERMSALIRGEAPLSAGIAGRVLAALARQAENEAAGIPRDDAECLSPRQMEVLALVAQGLTYKEVGARLFLSEPTIKYHMRQILDRLHLENRREVIAYARRMNLVGV